MAHGADRQAALARVGVYYESCLAALVGQVAAAVDRFRAGQLTAGEVDAVLHQYHRAARALWRFCWGAGADPQFVAELVDDSAHEVDWWRRGAPRER